MLSRRLPRLPPTTSPPHPRPALVASSLRTAHQAAPVHPPLPPAPWAPAPWPLAAPLACLHHSRLVLPLKWPAAPSSPVWLAPLHSSCSKRYIQECKTDIDTLVNSMCFVAGSRWHCDNQKAIASQSEVVENGNGIHFGCNL